MSPRRPRSTRLFPVLALTLGLALAGTACDKGGEGSKVPEGDKTVVETDGNSQGTGSEYVYAAEGFTLTSTLEIKFDLTTNQGAGAAELAARSLIEATPTDDGKFAVHGKTVELINYEGSGQMEPEFMKKQAIEQGQEPIDIVAQLREAENWLIIDNKGEVDKDATKTYRESKTDEQDKAVDFGLFSLPDLPPVDLVEGEEVTLPTREVTRELPFGEVPVQIDETWILRGIDENRVAELDVTTEGSGATEIVGQGGTMMISMLEESSYTVFFNLETKLPISFNGYSQNETQVDVQGKNITFATNTDVKGSYEVGAPTAAPAAAPAAAGEDAAGEDAATEAAPAD